jgi:sortase A
MGWLHKLERVLLVLGVVLLAFYAAARIHRSVLSKAELQSFKSRQQVAAATPHGVALTAENPDFSLWSERRIKDYQEGLAAQFAPGIAILRIPKIHVEVVVLEGTDDLSLNRGVGHVTGTANPGENGNMAIAGHRDGFFRGLKDIGLGDRVEIETLSQTEIYIVDRITIVDPSDVSVLKPGPHASLTLITCYPFYFVGSAPKRYIVQASAADSAPSTPHAVERPRQEPVGFDQANADELFRTHKPGGP